VSRDIFTDIAAIQYPMPPPLEDPQYDEYDLAVAEVDAERAEAAERLRLAWDEDDADPLLTALAEARRARERVDAVIRQLVAYGREFVQPRPYTLADLAEATGMSISGIRTGYDHRDVDTVTEATGAKAREWRAPESTDTDPAALRELLDDLERRSPAATRDRVSQVYLALEQRGWTPYAPAPGTPGTRATKRHIRWVRKWPGGTTVTLYQEPGSIAASNKVGDELRKFHVDYTEHNARQVIEQLDTFTEHVEQADRARRGVQVAAARREPR
jgi:hypothetical protein